MPALKKAELIICSIIVFGASFFIPPGIFGEALTPKILPEISSFDFTENKTETLPILQSLRSHEVFSRTLAEHPRISHYIELYTGEKWALWLEGILKRAFPYRHHIVLTCSTLGLPRELQFLPIVESAYNIKAVSRSGAAGLWQFMLNSIAPYDIQINEWLDERRDFWKSTEAALKKLEYNYTILDDWLLALAAYNCGLGRMTRLIKSTGIDDFWKLSEGEYLPYETAEYIPKFLALSIICSYPGRYGLSVTWDTPIVWDRLALSQAVDLSLLAEKSEIPLSLLKQGNAELKYSVTPPGDANYFLKVPAEYSDVLKETLENTKLKLMRFYVYSIKSGDTLYDLSNHYGVSVPMIQNYNPRIKPRSLRIGQRIVIPSLKDVPPYQGKAKGTSSDQLLTFSDTYTVKKGDTLWGIALRYSISPEDLAERNMLTLETTIHSGLVLKVPRTAEKEENCETALP